MTLSELLIAVAILGILSVVTIGEVQDALVRARVSACMLTMRQVQRNVFQSWQPGESYPTDADLWNYGYRGSPPRGIYYLVDNDDPNSGHGNDLDGFDEQNPGNSPRTAKDIHFVVVCNHDHGRYADYIYIEDDGPPLFAFKGRDDPKYDRFIGRPVAGGGGGNNGGGNNGGGNNG